MREVKKVCIGIIAFISLSFGSIFDTELDCALMGKVSEFEGHYYAISSYTMSFEEALILTENTNAYIAIPESKEENEFLTNLLLSNELEIAFIGIYDSSCIANYCYSDDKCVFDDSRFRTIKNKPMYYKNWADKEPNNKANINDKEANFSKFKGEHYVILLKNGKWADVGFEERHNILFEFDEKPNCFTPINTGEKE